MRTTRRLLEEADQHFACYRLETSSAQSISDMLRTKQLKPLDVAVFYALLEAMTWKTGKVHLSIAALSRHINISYSHLSTSAKRLRDTHLIANERDPRSGERWIRINPYYAWAGGESGRDHSQQEWNLLMSKRFHPELEEPA